MGDAADFTKKTGIRLRPSLFDRIPWISTNKKIGFGSYGSIYKSVDRENVHWAVKRVNLALGARRESSLKTLAREAYYYKLFGVNGIGPRLYEDEYYFYVDKTYGYIVMELAEGSLKEFITRSCPLTPELQSDIEDKVRTLLIKSIRMGVTCVDQKPGNILYRKDGSILLTDFGADFCYEIDKERIRHAETPPLLLFLMISLMAHCISCDVVLFRQELCTLSELSELPRRRPVYSTIKVEQTPLE